jgi:hypothetical protein
VLVRYMRVSPRLAGSQQYPQAGTAAAALWCASLESFRQPGVGHAGWLHPLPLAVASAPGKRTASAAAQRSRASQPHHARRGVLFFASSCGSGRSLSPPGTGVQPQNVLMGAAGSVGAVVHLCCIAVCPTQPLFQGHAAASEESAVCAHCPALPAAAGSTPWRQAVCPPCICPPFRQPARLSVCCGQAGGGAPSSVWLQPRLACSRAEQLQLPACWQAGPHGLPSTAWSAAPYQHVGTLLVYTAGGSYRVNRATCHGWLPRLAVLVLSCTAFW